MYVTMSIAFRLLIAASNIAVLFNARPLGAGPTSAVIPLMRAAARSVIARPNADAFAVSRSERRL